MRKIPELKPLFVERMKILLEEDFTEYLKILEKEPLKSIRCNTLKISPEKLIKKLEEKNLNALFSSQVRKEEKNWKIKQLFKNFPEIMIVENELEPGELGRSLEHMLGYYYIQEIASMLPILALNPKPNEFMLDLCASPGSKTTQISAMMKNSGTIIANEVSLGRIKILASNAERCGVANTILTKKEGSHLCRKFLKENIFFDKILIDAPCSGEGTLRSTPKTYKMWNINTIKKLSGIQKNLLISAIDILKPNGEIVYSTCTHAPEENEEVLDFALKKFGDKIKIENISLPIKCRQGITKWNGEEYDRQITKSCRIYPQDNDTEGFFIAKIKKLK